MEHDNRCEAWETRYRSGTWVHGREPNQFLKDNVHLLPGGLPGGQALDVAMGEGRNAVFLAQQGYVVTGLDCSPTAVERAIQRSARSGVALDARVVDLEEYTMPKSAFDVIVITHYLQRGLFVPVIEALRPGGALVYETFTVEHLKYKNHDRIHLLEPGELLSAFRALEILRYREVDLPESCKCVASLVARKRP